MPAMNDILAVILARGRGTDINTGHWVVQDGIVVIPKNSIIAPGTHIEPAA